MSRVAIIGAGITGITTAYTLAKRGYAVTVIDKHRDAAMETSFANGGQLSASNAEVWNNTATVAKGLRWLGKRNAPLLFNPAFSWHKYGWIAAFVRNIPNHKANTIETTRLAIEARQYLYDMAEKEQIEFDLEKRGILHIYYDRDSFDKALKTNALLQAGGLERYAVTREEAKAIEPALTQDFFAGLYTPSDATGDIHKFTSGLAAACRRLGVRFEMDASVTAISTAGQQHRIALARYAHAEPGVIEADQIVVCAGTGSHAIARMLGDRMNVYPVKGYSISVHLDDADSLAATPRVSLLDEDAKIVTSFLGDRFRVAGTAEFNGYNKDIRADRVQPLVDWTRRLFPDISTKRVVPWCGLRPMMPDMMPRVCRGRKAGVFYNTGHGHLGWTLSAVTAQQLARLLEESSQRSTLQKSSSQSAVA